MSPFTLLANPADYSPHTLDLEDNPQRRQYWIDVFVHHLPSLVEHCIESEGDSDHTRRRAENVRENFLAILEHMRSDPDAFGPISVVRICQLREQCLREQDFADPYCIVKARENTIALKVLPSLLAELDAMPPEARLRALIAGVFAGNIFDLGASQTIELYRSGSADFHSTREKVARKPWLVDHFHPFASRAARGYRKAVLFVDNAGADVVLGMIPFARHLLQSGTQVALAANTTPALNDITEAELHLLLNEIADFDPTIRQALASRRLSVVPSGNDIPLIDLRSVSDPLNAAARDADLLVLEGMGRAVESNWNASFTVDTLKLAMLKEADIAVLLHGTMFDVVCRFDPASHM